MTMAQKPLNMGFLSSLNNISFPANYILVWVTAAQSVTTQVSAQVVVPSPNPSSKINYQIMSGETPTTPLGSASVQGKPYGGVSTGLRNPHASTFWQNFLTFRGVGDKSGMLMFTISFQSNNLPSKPYNTLAVAILRRLPYPSLQMTGQNTANNPQLNFASGFFYLPSFVPAYQETDGMDTIQVFKQATSLNYDVNTVQINLNDKTILINGE